MSYEAAVFCQLRVDVMGVDRANDHSLREYSTEVGKSNFNHLSIAGYICQRRSMYCEEIVRVLAMDIEI